MLKRTVSELNDTIARQGEIITNLSNQLKVILTALDVQVDQSGLVANRPTSTLATLTSELRQMRSDFDNYRQSHPEPPPAWPSASINSESKKEMRKLVHEELSDKQRRSRNVVVSGLPPVDGIDDSDLFVSLCERFLPIKPVVNREKCRRLGAVYTGKVRPLLVSLRNKEAADDLLKSSHQLRNSAESAAIYINPDLTPAEVQAAYERRVKRRERLHNGSGNARQVEPQSLSARIEEGATLSSPDREGPHSVASVLNTESF
jgi:uncharacterized coiled-coil protein SlyX